MSTKKKLEKKDIEISFIKVLISINIENERQLDDVIHLFVVQ